MGRNRIERVTIKLPADFDKSKHQPVLERRIAEIHGEGFVLESISPGAGTATATRQVEMVEVSEVTEGESTMDIKLTSKVKPADGDKFAARLEDQNEGYYMTAFEPFLGYATMTRLTDDEARCRGAVALALGVKPWDVQVKATVDGGFTLGLPRTYVPSKHDAKLEEVAVAVVGHEGWYVTANAKNLTARIVPSDPPTFPAAIPYPLGVKKFDAKASWRIPVGKTLGGNGHDGEVLELDFDGTPGALVVGTAGSGKTVSINALIAGALARGFELAIGDVPHKAIDFTWCKDFVRPGGWGCDSPAATLTMLKLVYEEGKRRATLLAEHDVQKIQELPAGLRPKPIMVVLDEVTGMFALEEVPKGIPKTHPLVREATATNLIIQMIKLTVAKIPAELRFVGIRIIVATQMAQANTGISVPLKTNLANRMLLGSNPNEAARGHAFLDPRSVPAVPENIKADRNAARGVGGAEFEGQVPVIFKSYFATTRQYQDYLNSLGVPTTSRPAPTAAEIAKHTPNLDDDDDERPASRLSSEGGFGEQDGRDAPAPRLRGAAAAAHDLNVQAAAAARASATS